jgi:hypothetical protein
VRHFPKVAADPGRIAPNSDIAMGPLKLALFEVPEQRRRPDGPRLMLAASTSAPGWARSRVEIGFAGRRYAARTPARKSVLGVLIGSVGPGEDTIEVALHDAEQWLICCADGDLELGDNVAMLGAEVIQFGHATSLGQGRFRLGRLLRGRTGTEITNHSDGEPFVMLDLAALEPIRLPAWIPNEPVSASTLDGAAECSVQLSGAKAKA